MLTRKSNPTRWIQAASLLLLVFIAFAVAIRGDFLWDDDAHVTANPCIIGPLGLREIWTSSAANYFPLVLTNFWIQHALWGLNPVGYHIVTIGFHAATAVMVWLVLRRLGVPGAWLGAALWALHPVQVESVAWICELKNTQSGLFFFLAIWLFLEFIAASQPGRRRVMYLLMFTAALAALFSKPSTVMLPVALLLCAWWQQRSVTLRRALSLLPFFAVSAAASLWTIWEQKYHSGALGTSWDQTPFERLQVAVRVPWFYLEKLLWPDLSFIYPRWQSGDLWWWVCAAAWGGSIAALVYWWKRRPERAAEVAFAGAYFVALLFPVLGFFNVYFFRYSYVGDHFQYLASVAPIALFAAYATKLLGRFSPAALGVVAVLGLASAERCRVFVNDETLWKDTLAANPHATIASTHLGAMESLRGNRERAMAYFQDALAKDPHDYYALSGVGLEYLTRGDNIRAEPLLRQAVDADPNAAAAHNNLGRVLQNLGKMDEAKAQYDAALHLDPTYANAHDNMGTLLTETGSPQQALQHFDAALQKHPNEATTHHNRANAYRALGRYTDAEAGYRTAIRLKPMPETYDDLGVAYGAMDRSSDAIAAFEQALKLRPDFSSARQHLAELYVARATKSGAAGDLSAALDSLDRATSADANYAPAHFNRGVALAQLGRWRAARDEFATAARLDPKSAATHRYLGIAFANLNALTEAEAEAAKAVELDPSPENRDTHARIEAALAGKRPSASR